jgi:RHS repeat-associated protein
MHDERRASNPLYRDDALHAASSELYAYDGLHRLVDTQRGTLNGAKDAITTLAFQQNWSLDGLGNWLNFKQDDNGNTSGGWDLDQTRSHNQANEITGITPGSGGGGWHTPAHDAAGNMVEMPKPQQPDEGFEAVYDAWNRMVKLIDEGTQQTVAEYQWDGMNRRTIKVASGEERQFYYSIQHQILEERVDGDVQVQYVWGFRYVDELILRDRDSTGDGTLNQRHYALQDANFNVTAIVDTSGDVVERYRYSPYGERTVLNADFSPHSNPTSGSYAFAVGHQGLMRDPESGLMYNRARMLHPVLGRFVQRDPLGYVDGMSLYLYVMGGPIIHRDPYGLTTVQDYGGNRAFFCNKKRNECYAIYGFGSRRCEDLHSFCVSQQSPSTPTTGFREWIVETVSPDTFLTVTGGQGHVPGIDHGTTQTVIVTGCSIVGLGSPIGATYRVVTCSSQALRIYRSGGCGRQLVRVRQYIRHDPPHHGMGPHWDGKFVHWWRRHFGNRPFGPDPK